MNIKTYSAHGAHFLTLTDGPKETTILRASADEPLADTLNRYLAEERNTLRCVNARIAFFEQARAQLS
mgnify:CR=1 FL=1